MTEVAINQNEVHLYACALIQAVRLHVSYFPGVTIYTPGMLACGVLGLQ